MKDRKAAYLLQESQYGGISEQTKAKIKELIAKLDPINNKALRPQVTSGGKVVKSLPFLRDKRLPIPGTEIHKKYKGTELVVKVLEKGFEFNGKRYRSLSGVAKAVTGDKWNGFNFFKL